MKLSIVPAVFDCLRYGGSVADAFKSRNRAMLGTAFGLLITAVSHVVDKAGYGSYVEFIDADMAQTIGLFVAGLFAAFGHFATDERIGLLPAKPETENQSSIGQNGNDTAPATGQMDIGSHAATTLQQIIAVRVRSETSNDSDNYLPG